MNAFKVDTHLENKWEYIREPGERRNDAANCGKQRKRSKQFHLLPGNTGNPKSL